MTRIFLFADEAGDLIWPIAKGRSSAYFIVGTIALPDCKLGERILDLRRDLAWEGLKVMGEFHATEDAQRVRDRVFALLGTHDFRADATIFTKTNIYLRLRSQTEYLYKLAWYYHLRSIIPRVTNPGDEILVVGASYGTKKRFTLMHSALYDVVLQCSGRRTFRTAYWSAASDPCLQAADYCCWAIQRKWESNDDRSYVLIRDKISREEQFFK